RDIVDLAQIERHERQRALPCLFGLRDRRGDLVALAARERDRVIAGGGELLRDGKAEPAAAAGDQHVARVLGDVVGSSRGSTAGHTLWRLLRRILGRMLRRILGSILGSTLGRTLGRTLERILGRTSGLACNHELPLLAPLTAQPRLLIGDA